jgi:hypothetical protein
MKTVRRRPNASKLRRNFQRKQKLSSPEVVIKRVATFDATGLTEDQVNAIFGRFRWN